MTTTDAVVAVPRVDWAEVQRWLVLLAGLGIVTHQTLFADELHPELLTLAAAMIGLPIVTFAFPDNGDNDDADSGSGGGG